MTWSLLQANTHHCHATFLCHILDQANIRAVRDVGASEEELRIKGYTDASFQTDKDDSRSQSGFVFCLNGGAVSWKSSKQETVANSTTEDEYIAASEAAKEAVWIKKFITGLGDIPSISDAVDLYCDNNGAIAQAKEPRSHQRSKHILRRFHLIREIIDRGDVEICKVHTDDNIADPLTKPLAQQKHDRHTESLGIRYIKNPKVAAQASPLDLRRLLLAREQGCAIFRLFRKEFPSSCSLVYSGGLSRDLDEIFVEIQDPRFPARSDQPRQAENSSTYRDTYLGRQGKYNRDCNMISIFFQTPLNQERVKPRPKISAEPILSPSTQILLGVQVSAERSATLLGLLYLMTSRIVINVISFILDSQYFLHSSSGEKFVERKIYLFDIRRVKLKERMNAVHVREKRYELTPPRNSGNEEVTAFPPRNIMYKQDKQLQDLWISQ
ncbi:hypothetical protein V6N11_001597 [Hibiscus sabdariffa]|uniref:Uncharacterized protein n=1 Tax=Hibiscus sabdariffa TaxID=183260 RepID=A0ABR2S095_9ROSI